MVVPATNTAVASSRQQGLQHDHRPPAACPPRASIPSIDLAHHELHGALDPRHRRAGAPADDEPARAARPASTTIAQVERARPATRSAGESRTSRAQALDPDRSAPPGWGAYRHMRTTSAPIGSSSWSCGMIRPRCGRRSRAGSPASRSCRARRVPAELGDPATASDAGRSIVTALVQTKPGSSTSSSPASRRAARPRSTPPGDVGLGRADEQRRGSGQDGPRRRQAHGPAPLTGRAPPG